MDATGFSIKRYNEVWSQRKHRWMAREYVKLHAAIDMEYRSIVSFHFTRTNVHEVTQLERLLKPLWRIGNVYADSVICPWKIAV